MVIDTVSRVIAEDDFAQVIFHPGKPDLLLCTFSELATVADGVQFWGRSLVRQAQFSALGFVARRPHWFPRASMERLAAQCREVLAGFQTRITYGFSMGGHAALRHAALLDATHVLAFSPQYTLESRLTPCENPWARHFDPALHTGMEIRTGDLPPGVKAFLFYDPFDPIDSVHARLIRAGLPELGTVTLPLFGHETVRPFASAEAIIRAVALAVAGDVPGLRQLARQLRRLERNRYAPARLRALAQATLRRGTPRRQMVVTKAIASLPEQEQQQLNDVLRRLPPLQDDKAEATMAAALEQLRQDPGNIHLLHRIGVAYMQQGKAEEALPYAYRAYLRSGVDPNAASLLLAALRTAGYLTECNRVLAAALAQHPDNPHLRHHAEHLRLSLPKRHAAPEGEWILPETPHVQLLAVPGSS